jgi:hypothetical protein
MTERLVDVLNDKNTVLQVYSTNVEDAPTTSPPTQDKEFEKEALKAASEKQLVAEDEQDSLRTRMHVSRGGQLAPSGAKP